MGSVFGALDTLVPTITSYTPLLIAGLSFGTGLLFLVKPTSYPSLLKPFVGWLSLFGIRKEHESRAVRFVGVVFILDSAVLCTRYWPF